MDIICTRCGEPWDVCLDDLDQEEKEQLLSGKGCPCCISIGDGAVVNINPDASFVQSALADVLGDDIDGLAAMMDDNGLL